MSYDPTNQRVLITASSSGIGKATALAFQGAGAKVAICARNESKLMETKSRLIQMCLNGVVSGFELLCNECEMLCL